MTLPRNAFYLLVPRRLNRLRASVEPQVWEGHQVLPVRGGPVNERAVPLAEGRRQRMRPVRAGEYFGPPGGGWNQRWFQVRVPAARPTERGRRVLFWKCRGEATAYLDGATWAGLDVAHPYCPLPDKAATLWIDVGTYQTGVWMPHPVAGPDAYGLRFDEAYIACRNEDAWHVKHDLDVLAAAIDRFLGEAQRDVDPAWRMAPLPRYPAFVKRLLTDLDAACDAYDDGLPALRRALAAVYAKHPAEYWQPVFSMAGQAHLDLVWLWPERESERKAVHTTATVLRLLERYPEFRFVWSQPAMLDMIKRLDPGLFARMLREVRRGRIELTGALEVEFDSQVPCGEALARSLAYGQRRLAALRGGALSRVVWLPDSFGFTQCLPQLMALAGVPYFYTTKISWNQLTRFPHDSFEWQGPDGTAVLAHLSPPVAITLEVPYAIDSARTYEQAGVHGEVLRAVGHGDGAGGPNEETLERARRMRNLVGLPKVQWSRAEDFFDRLARVRGDLPVYQGELYLELHRGCATSQAEFKRVYRRAEQALQAHEAVRAARGGKPLGFEAWRRVLFAQFHDALPGSSIEIVYKEMNPELERLGAERLAAARADLARGGKRARLAAFNALPLARSVAVDLAPAEAASLPAGTALQRLGTGRAARSLVMLRLPPVGAAVVAEAAVDAPAVSWRVSRRVLDNGVVRAEFDAAGQLAALRIDGRDMLLAAPAGLILCPELSSDAWELERYSLGLGKPVATRLALGVAERGPVRARLHGEAKIGRASRIALDFILEAGSPYLRVEADVDWREASALLKYHVPTGFAGRFARYGCPFGSIQRQQVGGLVSDEAKWEVYGSRWAAVTDEAGDAGLAVLTEAKYGFSCRDGDLAVSLLRAPQSPDPRADRGRHRIRLAIGAFRAATTDDLASTPAAADALFAPVVVAPSARPPASLLGWSDLGTLVPSWVCPAEASGGYLVRLHETMGGRGTAVLHLARAARGVRLVDLLERPRGRCERIDARTWRIAYRPYQILTVHVRT